MSILLCALPAWPLEPFIGFKMFAGLMAIAGVIFSLVMLIDCLKRPNSKYFNPITKNAQYDKIIWAVAIVASLSFYFLGAIVYLFVVHRASPEQDES